MQRVVMAGRPRDPFEDLISAFFSQVRGRSHTLRHPVLPLNPLVYCSPLCVYCCRPCRTMQAQQDAAQQQAQPDTRSPRERLLRLSPLSVLHESQT